MAVTSDLTYFVLGSVSIPTVLLRAIEESLYGNTSLHLCFLNLLFASAAGSRHSSSAKDCSTPARPAHPPPGKLCYLLNPLGTY